MPDLGEGEILLPINLVRSRLWRISGLLLIILLGLVIYQSFLMPDYVDLEASQIREDINLVGMVGNANTIGQSFVSTHSNLSSIRVNININSSAFIQKDQYQLTLRLRDKHKSVIASNTIQLYDAGKKGYILFAFAPQANSKNNKYELELETNAPPGYISLWGSFFDVYPDGDAILNNKLLPFDLTFSAFYRPSFVAWFTQFSSQPTIRLIKILVATLIFGSIGYCICFLFGERFSNLIEMIVYSIGIGIATPSILFAIMSMAGVKINQPHLIIAIVLLILSIVIKIVLSVRKGGSQRNYICSFSGGNKDLGILILIFLLAACSRVVQVNELIMPNWVDGIVHQGILSNILERQALDNLTIYPKGFHSNVIFFQLLFLGDVRENTLLMGQLQSLLSGLGVYLVARRLLRSPYALVALGLYWFWFAYPAHLINWGRYPFLQGLTLLPILIDLIAFNFSDARKKSILLGILMFGLGMTYYGSLLMFLAFIIALLLDAALNNDPKNFIGKAKYILLSMLPIIIILLLRMKSAFSLGVFGQDSYINGLGDAVTVINISFQNGGFIIWLLGILGLLMATINRQNKITLLAKWILVLFIINQSQDLFGVTISSYSNSIIMLSIPLVIFAAYLYKLVFLFIFRRSQALTYLVVLLIVFLGAYNLGGKIVRPNVLFSLSDQKAFEWMSLNLPKDKIILINSFLWGDDIAPSDGGGWITSVLGYKTILYNGINLADEMSNENINYIYIGRGFGDLNPDLIMERCCYSLVYFQEGVRIIEVRHLE